MAQAKKKRRRNRNDPDRAEKAAQRAEALRRDREEKAAAAAAAERRAAIGKRIRSLLVPALVGIGVIAAGYLVFKPAPEVDDVQQPPAIESTIEVLAAGETFDYGTPTPTNGPYRDGDATCGVSTEPVALEDAVAALRVGAVVLWHQEGDTTTAAALAALAGEYESHVVVSPNPDITDTVVATSWNRLLAYDTPGDGVAEFLDTYRDRGDQNGDCPIG
ncbi:DUF3105 domain-containing protein [bacterium]|nr:DUF3105 domain-containing protein [bacterium]